jgi:hypothetical protein
MSWVCPRDTQFDARLAPDRAPLHPITVHLFRLQRRDLRRYARLGRDRGGGADLAANALLELRQAGRGFHRLPPRCWNRSYFFPAGAGSG